MGEATPLIRTLDQELAALARGASMECLVCGEFVLRWGGELRCPECGSRLENAAVSAVGCSIGSTAG
jgi:predicted amidophosphoribosyltransferase